MKTNDKEEFCKMVEEGITNLEDDSGISLEKVSFKDIELAFEEFKEACKIINNE